MASKPQGFCESIPGAEAEINPPLITSGGDTSPRAQRCICTEGGAVPDETQSYRGWDWSMAKQPSPNKSHVRETGFQSLLGVFHVRITDNASKNARQIPPATNNDCSFQPTEPKYHGHAVRKRIAASRRVQSNRSSKRRCCGCNDGISILCHPLDPFDTADKSEPEALALKLRCFGFSRTRTQ
jgi:hypothetical protein